MSNLSHRIRKSMTGCLSHCGKDEPQLTTPRSVRSRATGSWANRMTNPRSVLGGLKPMKSVFRTRLMASTLLIGASMAAAPAFAQVTDGAQEEDAPTTVTITGTRIARPDLEAPSPVTTVSAEQIALTGTQTLENLVNELPQVIPGNTRVSNNSGGENFATLDLRGLGPGRTLILLNGERLPASTTTGVTDISQIPVGLIQRVDVVTGGASAVYGSDAIAGVVNFILRDDYEGMELTAQTNVSEEGVGFNHSISGMFGGNFADGKGNITLYASYFDRDAVSQSRFDYSRVAGALVYDSSRGETIIIDDASEYNAATMTIVAGGGSATPAWGTITTNTSTNPFNSAILNTYPGFAAGNTPAGCTRSTSTLTFNAAGQLSPTFGSGACTVGDGPERAYGSSRYNYAPANYLITPYDRLNFSALGSYELGDDTMFRFYSSFTQANQQVNLAPTPATGISVPYNSPLIPADLAAALATRPDPTAPFTINRRFTETGPRDGRFKTNSFNIRGIVEHDLGGGWNLNAIASFGRVDNAIRGIGNINRTAVAQGLAGCPTGSLPGCVPIDIFGQNTLTPTMVNFVQVDTQSQETFEQVRAAVNLAGELFELPGGAAGVAVGAEYRKDTGATVVDANMASGNIYGFNAAQSISGSINVKEFYGEVRLPILGGDGFPDLLAIGAGARYSDYSSIGGLFNWKAEAEFAPIKEVRFRGTYNRAARAPNVFELFQNGDQGFYSYVDPCNAGATRDATEEANCAAFGVPAGALPGFAQINSQAQGFSFGDPTLTEEKAETWTIGAVISPGRVLGGQLNLTIDYYNIELTNRIAGQSPQFYLNQCYSQSIASACANITRDPATGQVTAVNVGRLNSPTPLTTAGVDVGFDWSVPVGDGARVFISNLTTYVDTYDIGGTEYADTAEGGLGGVTFRWANTATVGYRNDRFTGQVRYVWRQGGRQDYTGGTFSGYFDDARGRIPDLHLVNLSLRYAVTDNFEITGIVNNLLDKFPPQTAGGYFEQANTNINFYDAYALGRNFTFQAKIKL
ncbi:TonB-dependent receptor plug domain-containing protein [Sphingomonas suaedae]|uniref:TonB-dependent receptor plug domain-containing protein n=1 Tax=Sphingomonas suaedae TaxID=2599297 RepID=UPI0016447B7A|nr:TonB-dependent receptor [Sphingomonas suaedae]